MFIFVGREVDWVQCDGGCNKWYHMYCVGLVKNQIKPDDDYVCKKCRKQTGDTIEDDADEDGGTRKPTNYEEDYPDDGITIKDKFVNNKKQKV